MESVTFAMLGGGWRSEFYTRIANAAPERFCLRAVWIRNPEKAERYRQKYGVPVAASFEELLELDVDFLRSLSAVEGKHGVQPQAD